MGKTNTPEFTLSFQTDNLVYGKTNNPFDLQKTPGGSSGGAAAIIAAGASPFDIGTDTGGSIRLPSHFSGIAGIKPTTGRVPCTGNALPSTGLIAPLSQPGPMARYVEDLSYILNIISGPDLLDPHTIEAVWHNPADVDVSILKIGYHTDNGIRTPTKEIVQTVEDVIALLREHNLTATEARPTGIEMAGFIMSRVFSADAGEMLDALLEDCRTKTPSPAILENMKPLAHELDAKEFAQVLHLWHNYQSSMLGYFNDFDILICPVNARTAIKHGEKEEMENYTYTSAFNLTGWPSTVIRAGSDNNGLPIGVQILSRPFREDHCLGLAGWLESRLGPFDPPRLNAFG
jgi:amidase